MGNLVGMGERRWEISQDDKSKVRTTVQVIKSKHTKVKIFKL